MHVLAHRGNLRGPRTRGENSLESLRRCLARGFGVETDLRRAGAGRYYVAHDPEPATSGNSAERYFELFRGFPEAVIALNVKDPGHEQDLADVLEGQRLPRRTFVFDLDLGRTERLHPAALLRRLNPGLRVAVRVSERSEPVERALHVREAPVVWLDEFDAPWAAETDVRRLREAGKVIYAVSPELHGFPKSVMYRRWTDFRSWGLDGICTDFPMRLQSFLSTGRTAP